MNTDAIAFERAVVTVVAEGAQTIDTIGVTEGVRVETLVEVVVGVGVYMGVRVGVEVIAGVSVGVDVGIDWYASVGGVKLSVHRAIPLEIRTSSSHPSTPNAFVEFPTLTFSPTE